MIATLYPPGRDDGCTRTEWLPVDGTATSVSIFSVSWFPAANEAIAAAQESPAQAARREFRAWLWSRAWREYARYARAPQRAVSQTKRRAVLSPKIIVRKPMRSLPAKTTSRPD